jgi:hypothetical protein
MGLFRYRADSVGKQLLGLGPPRPAQHRESGDCSSAQTVGSRQFRRDRSPNREAWRFPDWTAVGFRLAMSLRSPAWSRSSRRLAPSCEETRRRIAHAPGPAPRGSVVLHIALPRCSDDVGPMRSLIGGLSPPVLRITGGDFNPACLCGRFSTPE